MNCETDICRLFSLENFQYGEKKLETLGCEPSKREQCHTKRCLENCWQTDGSHGDRCLVGCWQNTKALLG